MPAAFHAKAIVVGVCGCGGVWLELVEACERWSSFREALSGKSNLDSEDWPRCSRDWVEGLTRSGVWTSHGWIFSGK